MAKTRSSAVKISELRPRLLRLSALQTDLRERLFNYMSTTGATIATIAKLAGIPHVKLTSFRQGSTSIAAGRSLTGLCEVLGCPEIGAEIALLSEQVADRYLGYTTRSPAAIKTAVGVLEVHQQWYEDFTYSEFSEAFGDLSSTILSVLNGGRTGLEALEDAGIRDTIETILIATIDDLLADLKQRRDAVKQATIDQLRTAIDKLSVTYGNRETVYKVTGVSSSTIQDSLAGRSSLDTIRALTAKLEKHIRSNEKTSCTRPAGSPPPEDHVVPISAKATGPPPAETSAQTPAFQAEQLVEGILSMSRSELVAFVQTEANFRELENVQLIALRDALIVSLSVSQLLLNIGSQLDSKNARAILQQDVGRVLQELDPAIRRFTFAHPNQLLDLHDSQREVWKGNSSKPSQRKRGSK